MDISQLCRIEDSIRLLEEIFDHLEINGIDRFVIRVVWDNSDLIRSMRVIGIEITREFPMTHYEIFS